MPNSGDYPSIQTDRSDMESKKAAWLAMMELSNMLSVPMSLHAAVLLNVPDAIYQSGLNAPLTAGEILKLLKPTPSNPDADPTNLQRILRLLSSHGVFLEHIDSDGNGGPTSRRYSLTEVGKTLLVPPTGTGGPSYAAYVLQHHQDALFRAWPRLHDFVLNPSGPEPFALANGGTKAYQYYGKDKAANELMQRAMDGVSAAFMECFLDGYGGFDEQVSAGGGGGSKVSTLVDVGGSSGECLRRIMAKWPAITAGINFDLPEVVAIAPPFPGVTHVGGDMFKSVPKGDAVFMKWVLTTWTDEECVAILRNCHEALPEGGGKVVACEPVLPERTDSSCRTRALLEGDVFVMATYSAGGKERTESEFRRLGEAAGFHGFRAVYLDHFYTVLEFLK